LQEILGHDRLAAKEIHLNLSPEDIIREFHSKWQVLSGDSYVVTGPSWEIFITLEISVSLFKYF
jgi:hypothetical protein